MDAEKTYCLGCIDKAKKRLETANELGDEVEASIAQDDLNNYSKMLTNSETMRANRTRVKRYVH